MAVEDHQGVEQLVEVLGRIHAQKRAAVFDEFFIVGQDVARTVGRAALKEVVDGARLEEMPGARRDIQHVQRVFRRLRKLHELLLMGELAGCYNFADIFQINHNQILHSSTVDM